MEYGGKITNFCLEPPAPRPASVQLQRKLRVEKLEHEQRIQKASDLSEQQQYQKQSALLRHLVSLRSSSS